MIQARYLLIGIASIALNPSIDMGRNHIELAPSHLLDVRYFRLRTIPVGSKPPRDSRIRMLLPQRLCRSCFKPSKIQTLSQALTKAMKRPIETNPSRNNPGNQIATFINHSSELSTQLGCGGVTSSRGAHATSGAPNFYRLLDRQDPDSR